jgi:hypothetical protein
MNPGHTLLFYFFNIHFDIILSSTPSSPIRYKQEEEGGGGEEEEERICVKSGTQECAVALG